MMKATIIATMGIAAFCASLFAQTPDHVDWRSSGAVTPVRNQGQCESSYAFAAVGAVEGAHKIASGHLISLSEQELVDCSGVSGNHGCNGGNPDDAMQWIVRHGIATQAAYPYTARLGPCKMTAKPALFIAGVRRVATDEKALLAAVAKHPIAARIDASDPSFTRYEGGVYGCHTHSAGSIWVTIVGYGSTATGTPYWIIKGSFGTTWGESGYMRLTRACGNVLEAVEGV
jgi:KDEL-tailed cysteine endopeptidase